MATTKKEPKTKKAKVDKIITEVPVVEPSGELLTEVPTETEGELLVEGDPEEDDTLELTIDLEDDDSDEEYLELTIDLEESTPAKEKKSKKTPIQETPQYTPEQIKKMRGEYSRRTLQARFGITF